MRANGVAVNRRTRIGRGPVAGIKPKSPGLVCPSGIFVDDDKIADGNDDVAGYVRASGVLAKRRRIGRLIHADRAQSVLGLLRDIGTDPADAIRHLGLSDASTAPGGLLELVG